jgi:hypothetical protein
MPFDFDPSKTFDQNFSEFRRHLDAVDSGCAKILFDNLDTLLGDGDPSRARASRTAFNAAVLLELDDLPDRDDGQ